MKYLLDTNIVILALTDDPALPDEARTTISSPDCEKYVSIASIWEIVIKHAKSPNEMPLPGDVVAQSLEESGIPLLPIKLEHTFALTSLHTTDSHKDPFDRILMAQSKYEGMAFLTCDSRLQYYNEPTVHILHKKR